MTNINISLTQEAYEYLKSLKGRDKSFSQVVIEFKEKTTKKGSKEAVMKYFGVLKDVDWSTREKRMKAFRKEVEERFSEKK